MLRQCFSRVILVGTALACLAGCGSLSKVVGVSGDVKSKPSESRIMIQSFRSQVTGTDRDYWLYLPAGYEDDRDRQWPLMLFLHGGGERGDDIQKVLKHGPIKEVHEGRDLPFIIVAPQMPNREALGGEPRQPRQPRQRRAQRDEEERQPMERKPLPTDHKRSEPRPAWPECENDLLKLVETTRHDYRVDPNRIYLTGVSMGGYGTWYLLMRHPDIWAAAAPICGGGDPALVSPIGKVPLWVFHGGRDNVVPVNYSIQLANALKAAGGDVRLTVHEDMGHAVWGRVYEGEDFYTWLLAHKKD